MRKKLVGRIGEEKLARCGMIMKIKDYRYNNDFDVEFEDGTIVSCTRYRSFADGNIANPNLRKGKQLGTFRIIKKALTYRNKETNEIKFVLWQCKCKKCGYENLLEPIEMLNHKCNKEAI